MFTSPLEVKRREEGGREGSTGRKEVKHMNPPSPTPGEQTSPSSLEQEFPHVASLVPPPLPQPHAPSWLHPTIPRHPRPLDRTVATAAATTERKAKTCWQLGAEEFPGIWDKWRGKRSPQPLHLLALHTLHAPTQVQPPLTLSVWVALCRGC